MFAESILFGGLYVSSLLQSIPAWEPDAVFPATFKTITKLASGEIASPRRSAFNPVLPSLIREAEMTCLSAAVYHEARSEPVDGQKAVAMVIVNRVRSASYPSTICGVVFQNAHRPYRCQFSFTCTGVALLPKEEKPWRRAREIAAAMQSCANECARETSSADGRLQALSAATHYHASYVRPGWARRLHKLGRIGRHIFFARKRRGPV